MKKLIVAIIISIFILPSSISSNFDLAVKWVKVSKSMVNEGEIVEIKARIDNLGESHPFDVYFYLDSIGGRLIGFKHYDSINRYRLPRIEFDTKGIEGKHEIIVIVYDENESNNIGKCNITIVRSNVNYGLIIDSVYYYAYPKKKNEFISVLNCGNETNLNGFYITNTPWKRADKQNKIFLPAKSLKHGERIYLTQNGSSFSKQMGFLPDYEYYDASSIPDLKRAGSFFLSNEGGAVALKDTTNHTIDCIVYGNFSYDKGWSGNSIQGKRGYVIKRKGCNDTNNSYDWYLWKIGWSSFKPYKFKANKGVAFCSPDCSYNVIKDALVKGKNISINVYIFSHPYLYKILAEKNASLHLLLDGNVIGGIPIEERYIAWKLSKKGEVRYMYGNENEGIYKRYRFDHAKYAIIDNASIIESANWAMKGIPVDASYGNREWGIEIYDANLSIYLWKIFENDFNPMMEDSIPFNENDFFKGRPKNYSISFFIPHGSYRKKFQPLKINWSFNATLILTPDNGEEEILQLIEKARHEILIEQAYIQKNWHDELNPFLKKLVEKKKEGIKIKVLLNYNKKYKSTNRWNEEALKFLKEYGIDAKFSSLPIHNKGIIVDNYVLISSINWGENSVRNNREIGIIIEDKNISQYFKKIFYYDWNYGPSNNYSYYIAVILIFFITSLIIYKGRRRKNAFNK